MNVSEFLEAPERHALAPLDLAASESAFEEHAVVFLHKSPVAFSYLI
jgi:hypothetical protein